MLGDPANTSAILIVAVVIDFPLGTHGKGGAVDIQNVLYVIPHTGDVNIADTTLEGLRM